MNLTKAEAMNLRQLLLRVNDDLMRADRALKTIAREVDTGTSDQLLPDGITASRPEGSTFAAIGEMLDQLRAAAR
jgi:hypothetical protein